MKRREFLGVMTAGIGAAALGKSAFGVADAGSEPAKPRPSEPTAAPSNREQEAHMSPEAELVGYCGRYCGKCPASALSAGLGAAALQKVNDTVALSKSAAMIGFPPVHDMAVHCCADFDRELASLVDVTKIAFMPGCRKGCAPCPIPDCCKQKGYLTCAECDQTAKCGKLGKLSKYRTTIDANQEGIRRMGLEKWAKAQYEETVLERKAALHKAVDEAF